MPFSFARLASVFALVCIGVTHASGQTAFDIKTVDPETFRAIAFKITEAQRPDIDGQLTEEVWALAPAQGNFVQREPSLRRAVHGEDRVPRPLRRQDALHRRLGVGQRPGGIMGSEMKRDAGLNKGDQLKITHRHLSRSPQRVLLQHQPARRLQGRQHRRERPHHQLRLERGVEQQDHDRRQGLVHRDRHPAQPVALPDDDRRVDVGPQPVPDPVPQERGSVLGAVPARVGRQRIRARVERRRARRAEGSEGAAANRVRAVRVADRGARLRDGNGVRHRREVSAATSRSASPTI